MCAGTKIKQLGRVIEKFYAQPLKEAGVTLSQTSILFLIGKFQTLSQSEVGKIRNLERSTVTRDLQRLVDRNYVHKTPHPVSPILELTEEGKVFVETLAPIWQQAQDEAMNYLGEEGQQAMNILASLLKR